MNPIYQFKLSVNGGAQQIVRPLYADIAKEWNKESGYQFFRTTLSGKLTFISADYELIYDAGMEERFDLEILISYNNGTTWSNYWDGYFYTADCEFNIDDKTVSVQPKPKDNYDAILNALEKEVDLIPAQPQLIPLTYYKRPIVQIYVEGQAIVGCYKDGIYWEQPCTPVTGPTQLNNVYKFGLLKYVRIAIATGAINDYFFGGIGAFTYNSTDYSLHGYENTPSVWVVELIRRSDNVVLYRNTGGGITLISTLVPVSGSGATGTVNLDWENERIFARLICDVNPQSSSLGN